MNPEFCILCGASFPPREGEGRCELPWQRCQAKTKEFMEQAEQESLAALEEVSPPL